MTMNLSHHVHDGYYSFLNFRLSIDTYFSTFSQTSPAFRVGKHLSLCQVIELVLLKNELEANSVYVIITMTNGYNSGVGK